MVNPLMIQYVLGAVIAYAHLIEASAAHNKLVESHEAGELQLRESAVELAVSAADLSTRLDGAAGYLLRLACEDNGLDFAELMQELSDGVQTD